MRAIYTARVDSAICRLGPGDLSSLLLKLLEEIGVLLKNLFLRSIKIKRIATRSRYYDATIGSSDHRGVLERHRRLSGL